MRSTEVSIIIRTLNEARYLPHLLEAIDAQRSEFRSEVIVVDSGSTDGTIEIAQSHGCRILMIAKEDFSFGRSLNLGCQAALCQYLAIIRATASLVMAAGYSARVAPLAAGAVAYTYGRHIGRTETYWSEHRTFAKYFPDQSAVPLQGIYRNNANSALLQST